MSKFLIHSIDPIFCGGKTSPEINAQVKLADDARIDACNECGALGINCNGNILDGPIITCRDGQDPYDMKEKAPCGFPIGIAMMTLGIRLNTLKRAIYKQSDSFTVDMADLPRNS